MTARGAAEVRPGARRGGAKLRRVLWGIAGVLAMMSMTGCTATTANGETALEDGPLPPSPLGHFLAGRYATDQRDLGAAADLLSITLAADPNNPELLRDTYLAMVSEGRMAEAADLARRLLDAGVEGTPARLTLALEAVKAGDTVTARAELQRLPTEGFSGFVVPLLEAWVALDAEDVDAALAIADSLKGSRGLEPVRGVQAGLIADIGGRPQAAAEAFASSLVAVGNPPFRMVRVIGNYYQRSGRLDDAAAMYAQYSAGNPESVLAQEFNDMLADPQPAPVVDSVQDGLAEVLFDAASILRQEGATDVALIYIRMALDLSPDLLLGKLVLANIQEEQGHPDSAIETYRSMPEDDPLSWQARLALADLLSRNDRTDEAIALLQRMTEERPDQVDPPMQLGSVYRVNERFAEAARAYDTAVERLALPTPDRWSLFYFRGIANERSGEWAKAEADFLKALDLSPDHPYVLNYLAYSWIEQGINYDRALDMLKQAVDLRPTDGFIVDSLGWVYYRLGQYELAVEQLERANELLPTDPVLNDHLGDAYWRVGRRNEARFQWLRALQFGPEADQVELIAAKIDGGLGKAEPPPGSDGPSGN